MQSSIKRISILLPDLRGGGAERVFVNLAHHFSGMGFLVNFVTMRSQGELLEQVPNGSRVVDLKAQRIRNAFWPMVRYLRQNRPDVLLIGMWPLTIIGTLAHRLSCISGSLVVSDHSPLSASSLANTRLKRLALRATIRAVYPLATARLAVSNGVARDLSRLSGLSPNNFTVIHNPVVDESSLPTDNTNPWDGYTGKRLLAVGSLKPAKDYPTLIRAFARLRDKQEATLIILGEGNLRPELERLAASLGLSDSVRLLGFMADPIPWYRCADLFVLSSKWEGFGNVIVEAMAAGTPVVSTDCPSGPREILCDGKYGHLVPVGDVDALAEAMHAALEETPDSEALKARARDFSVDKIAEQYLDVMLPGWREKAA